MDFENFLHPQLRDGDFTLVPTDKYLSRKRGMDLSMDIKLSGRTHATTALLVSDVFRGDLSESVVLTEGTDLVFRSSLAYEGIILHENRGGPFFSGTHASSSLDFGFRNSFSDPVSLEHHGKLLLYQSLGAGVSVNLVEGDKRHYTIRLSLAQPLERGYGPSLYLTLASSPFKTTESGETVTVE